MIMLSKEGSPGQPTLNREFDPRSPEEKRLNQSAAYRIKNLLQDPRYKSPLSGLIGIITEVHSPSVSFGTIDPPMGFRLPILALIRYNVVESGHWLTTRHGHLPVLVKDANNNLYEISHYYFFNNQGQAAKLEKITKRGAGDHFFGETTKFTLSEKDSRYVPLDKRDHDFVEKLLTGLEAEAS